MFANTGKELEHLYHILYEGDRAGVKGTNIEKYYDDFKDVKIIPFKAIKEVMGISSRSFNNAISEHITSKKKRIFEPHEFIDNPPSRSDEYNYRTMLKMNWLINDIKEVGLREPITGVVSPFFCNNKIEYKFTVHPGSFRWHAYEIMDLNPDCIVFDAHNVFLEHDKASLDDCLALFADDNTKFEISILPNNDNFNCPQILNVHSGSKNVAMPVSLEKWHERTKHMWWDDVNIYIGTDRTHNNVHEICRKTIHSNSYNSGYLKTNLLDIQKIPEYNREYKNQSTEFSYSRFLAPWLSDFKGLSIFVDDDFIITEDIAQLLYHVNPKYAVSVVKHNFDQKYSNKFAGEKDVWYDKKLWSSLMVFNNAHPDCQKLTPEVINSVDGSFLHQFKWTTDAAIGSLPEKWNWCEGYSDIKDIHDAKGVHYTRGGPWIDGQDCTDIQGLNIWHAWKLPIGDVSSYNERRQLMYLNIRDYYDVDEPAEEGETQKYCREKIWKQD